MPQTAQTSDVQSINPATGQLLETFTPHSGEQIEAKLAIANDQFQSWRAASFETRADLLRRAAGILEDNKHAYAKTMTQEMGKPLNAAIAEVEKCALVCNHYAAHGAHYLADETIETDAAESYVRHLPLGPVLAVMPWNYPFWQVFRFAAPTLMAGNVGLLKHASNVWRSALNIEEVFNKAGFPEGCFQTLLIGSSDVESVIKDKRTKAVTLTGSGPAGAAVAASAGDQIKPSLLELGGTDAFIVMPSADLQKAVDTAITARTKNNGQSCIAAKRFFVHSDIYAEFKALFTAQMNALKIGDPMDASTDIGPLATPDIRDELAEQVHKSKALGARSLCEKRDLPATGYYFAPDILTDIPDDSPAAIEEMFGPVACLWKVDSLDDAIARANASAFGLGSAIFTKDRAEINTAINTLEAGSTFVNAMVASDPRLPFGGIKQSGYGRELARDGILTFVNRKTVSII